MDYKTIGLNSLGAIAIGGALIGGGYYYMTLDTKIQDPTPIRQFNRPLFKTIREALADKKPLISTDTTKNEVWKKLIKKHLETSESEDKKIKITDLKAEENNENESFNIAIFKHACEELFKKPESFGEEKEIAENWCTETSPLLTSVAKGPLDPALKEIQS